jgi:hypothetical protein
LQSDVLRRLAAQRNPESNVAGSTPLHRDGPRFSSDIDIFHHREERVAAAATEHVAILSKAGFKVEWLRCEPGIHAVSVERGEDSTKLEWVRDSDSRFYPAMSDALFGYTLHLVDIATNNALAATGRRAPRDALDLLYVHEHHLPWGQSVGQPSARIPDIRRKASSRRFGETHATATTSTRRC